MAQYDCIDYHKVNKIATFNAFLMPQVDDMLEKVGQAQYVSTLNLTKGYWQIPMAAVDKEKMDFGNPWGLFQVKWMPFRLHWAAASFQWLMDQLLAAHQEYAAAYIDDIIVFSWDCKTHGQHL